ncbi:hypothetical protein [Lysobacter gummosus]|uniref:hypothetical protein n=1 Tax=Lysobacter gummosus TaxID=262324 RepID=UPI00362F2D23
MTDPSSPGRDRAPPAPVPAPLPATGARARAWTGITSWWSSPRSTKRCASVKWSKARWRNARR